MLFGRVPVNQEDVVEDGVSGGAMNSFRGAFRRFLSRIRADFSDEINTSQNTMPSGEIVENRPFKFRMPFAIAFDEVIIGRSSKLIEAIEQHTGGFQTTGDPAWLTRAEIGAGVWSTLKPGAMLLAAVTPRGLAGEETIVEITPMIEAGSMESASTASIAWEASSTFGQPLIQRVVALRIIAGAGRSGMKPQVLSSP